MYLSANRRAFLRSLSLATASLAIRAQDKQTEPVYEPGGDVKAPKLIHYVEPEFSPASKEAYVEGTVKLSTVVTRDGKASASKVIRGLSAEEDRTAIEALDKWTFEPGTKAGHPVCVHITVEIDFHLL